MPGTTVRVSRKTGEVLRKLSKTTGESMQAILDKAVEEYRRKRFLEEANRAFAALKNNSEAWKEEVEERELWNNTLADDLEEDEN